MSRLWPVDEAAQADYERLREAVVLTGRLPDDVASARFSHRGLAGLIAWPEAEPSFVAVALGADRSAWTPYGDPRIESLAAVYGLLLGRGDNGVARGCLALAGSGS
ncbi:MAG: hypothetical protein ACYCX8_10350 [Acidimicrobiales bacterium]